MLQKIDQDGIKAIREEEKSEGVDMRGQNAVGKIAYRGQKDASLIRFCDKSRCFLE